MDIRLMGNVEIHDGNRAIPLPRAGERCVLASLALAPRRRIHVDNLIDRLWGDDPPTGASHTLATYLRTVRKAIGDAGGQRAWLRNHRPATYELDIDPSLVDYHRFTALAAEARARQRDRKPADAITLYRKALALRTGEVLGNVTGQWAANRRYAIEQEHLDAVCALYEQQLTIGEYGAVATDAIRLVTDIVPTDRMIVLAIHGLARSGQHAAIPGFLTRATQRMWDTAAARPGQQVLALARQLTANPGPSPRPQPDAASVRPPAPPDNREPDRREPDRREPDRRESVGGSHVVMTAEHNQQVYQAAGDQYITGA
jgi:DNA-binding SARP family transcriptional activator